MRTRCPHCDTVFRITAEQLRVRFGMVRCGQCQAVFNAFDSLVEGSSGEPIAQPVPAPEAAATPQPPGEVATNATQAADSATPDDQQQPPEAPLTQQTPLQQPDPVDPSPAKEETPEQSTRAAREAGLMAVRDLTETPGYDRWSASTLAGADDNAFAPEATRRHSWPFALAALILVASLGAQMVYFFRGQLVIRFPALASAYRTLDIGVPLPRQADLVSIEVSDLQSDDKLGLLVLQATLRNRAEYTQEWPLLEFTLTDTHDAVVARRVLKAADYLPALADRSGFAGHGEIGVKLWLSSKQPAAGYRLFVFYP